jgi:hypothetical protein
MNAKLRKSLGFLFVFILGIYLSTISFIKWSEMESITMDELEEIGFYNLQEHPNILYSGDSIKIRLNDKQDIDNFDVKEYNENANLYKVPTTFIPNRDAFFNKKEWKVPDMREDNLNYFLIKDIGDSSDFYIPAINDFESISQGYPVIFIYLDSLDYFSDSTGIYVPGLEKKTTNIKKDGNYAERGKEWERKVYFQLFSGAGKLIDDGWAGSRIHGNLSRAAPQKSLRFYAREKYGKQRFTSPYQDSTQLKRFLLRSPFSSSRELVYKDAMISDVALGMGMDAMRSTPVKVYFNGEYWGFHNYRDRVDEYFFFENYAIENVDFLDLFSRVKFGSNKDYNRLNNWLNKNDLRKVENYEKLLNEIDIENYTNYLLIELYFGNKDWPHNNVRIWKSDELDNKWRWLIFDLDASGKDSVDMAAHIIKRGDAKHKFWGNNLFFGLMANDIFYQNLIEQYLVLREKNLNKIVLENKADSLRELYLPLLPDQINRWAYPESVEKFEKAHTNFLSFISYRDSVLLEELERIHIYAIQHQNSIFTE